MVVATIPHFCFSSLPNMLPNGVYRIYSNFYNGKSSKPTFAAPDDYIC